MKNSQGRFREHGLIFLAPHLNCSIPIASLLQVKGRFSSKVGGNRHFLLAPRLNCRTTKIRECSNSHAYMTNILNEVAEGANISGALPEDVDILSELSVSHLYFTCTECVFKALNLLHSTALDRKADLF